MHTYINSCSALIPHCAILYSDSGRVQKNYDNTLLWQQFRAMVSKRLLSAVRNINLAAMQLCTPLIFTILACFILSADFATIDIYEHSDMSNPNPLLALYIASWVFQAVFSFGFAFLTASFISFLIEERMS